MGQPAAKKGDQIMATDMHFVIIPSSPSPVLLPHPFTGTINGNVSADVNIMGVPAATVDSTADSVPHIPAGASFAKPPSNKGTIKVGSPTVLINGKMAARNGDMAMTCNDPADSPMGTVIAVGTVFIG